ncbi:hypothetical protein [Geodermatophilus sp. DSM 45219]|uniref:hypothetical protein n=1 Tax=Geodermatophilus sp. DSM 45219 TaxID=1881103 RepID=UPI0008889394|nr:hypothetical protein [Geodermatophilus sp. DSM 45219]SDN78663.1 hypothetical protein SAMN05428965_1620 [Geodermatophilus sp. DSM 45219]
MSADYASKFRDLDNFMDRVGDILAHLAIMDSRLTTRAFRISDKHRRGEDRRRMAGQKADARFDVAEIQQYPDVVLGVI